MLLRTSISPSRSTSIQELCDHLESRVLLTGADLAFVNNQVTLADVDGDQVTVKLIGPGSISGHGSEFENAISDLTLTGTNLKSVLSITVTKGANGDGFAKVGSITNDDGAGDLGGINAPKVDLHNGTLHTAGALKSLTINTTSSYGIDIAGNFATPISIVSRALTIGSMTLGPRLITSLVTTRISSYTLYAGAASSFVVNADPTDPDSGKVTSYTINLSGVVGVKTTLGKFSVDRLIMNGSVSVTGAVGSVVLGEAMNGGFNAASVGSVALKRSATTGAPGNGMSFTFTFTGVQGSGKTLSSFVADGTTINFTLNVHGKAGRFQSGYFYHSNVVADTLDSFTLKRNAVIGTTGEFFEANLNVGTQGSTGKVLKSFAIDGFMQSAGVAVTGRIGTVVGPRFAQASLTATEGIDSIVVKSSPLVADSGQVALLNISANNTPMSAKSIGSITVQGAASQLAVFVSGRIGPVKAGDLINANFQSPGSIDSITSAATIQGLFVAATYGPIKAAGFMEATMTATGVTTKGVSFDSIKGGAATLDLTTPQELLAQGRINTLNFSSISSLDIQAGSLGSLKVTGDASLGTVNLTDTTRPQALDSFTAGFVLGSMQIAGNAGDFKFGGMTDFNLAVGTTLTPEQVAGLGSSGLPAAAAGLFTDAVHGVIKSFTVPHPGAGSPSNAGNPNLHVYSVVARRIKSLTLFHGFATNLNFDKTFGIATTYIDKATLFTGATPTATDKFTNVDANSLKAATISMPNHASENADRFDFDLGNDPFFIKDAALRLYKV